MFLQSPILWIRLSFGLAIGASLAWWAMTLLTPLPRPAPITEPDTAIVQDPKLAARLLGPSAPAVEAQAPAPSAYRVLGAIGQGAQAAILVQVDPDAPKAVRPGEEIAPGVVFQSLRQRHVQIQDHGNPKNIELPTPPTQTQIRPVR